VTELSAGAPRNKNRWTLPILCLVVGLLLGMGITALVGWTAMPGMMLTVNESRYPDVDRTCAEMKKAIEAKGWTCPAIRDMNKAMAKHGVQFSRPVRIVELCKADYAKRVLATNPEVATLMPCAWGVYEGLDGKVYVSRMNMGLMGKMFGGVIAEVMGSEVASDEDEMLKTIIKQ